ncbi:unnamed protein product [Symbiodinium microadriaticum]|nr:unnamed protein product [Symbiodinium microadriaticum]
MNEWTHYPVERFSKIDKEVGGYLDRLSSVGSLEVQEIWWDSIVTNCLATMRRAKIPLDIKKSGYVSTAELKAVGVKLILSLKAGLDVFATLNWGTIFYGAEMSGPPLISFSFTCSNRSILKFNKRECYRSSQLPLGWPKEGPELLHDILSGRGCCLSSYFVEAELFVILNAPSQSRAECTQISNSLGELPNRRQNSSNILAGENTK